MPLNETRPLLRSVTKKPIPCPICETYEHRELYRDELGDAVPPLTYAFRTETTKTYRIVQCLSCRHIFTNPMPELEPHYQDVVDDTYLNSSEQRQRTARCLLKKIVRHKDNGRLLDIGCSTGFFLDEAQAVFDVEGLEASNWAANIAAKHHKIYRDIEKIFPNEQYDVISLLGVIEHFENPAAIIREVSKRLKPTGLLVLYTGDVEAWLPRLLGKKWWWYQGMHLHFFSKRGCIRLLEENQLHVIADENFTTFFKMYSLSVSLNRYKVGRLISPFLNLPLVRDMMVPLTLSGEMLLIARKT